MGQALCNSSRHDAGLTSVMTNAVEQDVMLRAAENGQIIRSRQVG